MMHATKKLCLTLSLLVTSTMGALAAPINVTLNKPATLSGTFGVLRAGSPWSPNPVDPAGSIDDGVFRPENTVWNEGSIWWDATVAGSENNSITIDLQGAYAITGIITQADDNDSYQIDYFDPHTSTWIGLGHWDPVNTFGLVTRPNSDQVTPFPISFDASAIRLSAFGGDGYYAYSEFQAFGSPISEPVSLALLGLAFAGMGFARRHRLS